MLNVLVIGYGNPDREDDGVAWHLLKKLSTRYDCPMTAIDELDLPLTQCDGVQLCQNDQTSPCHLVTPSPSLVFALQLTPEMAETLTRYDRVCFVDAHTGAYPEAVRFAPLRPGYQATPFTHHLTPESCLALAHTLYGHAPEAVLLSIRGYHFGYSTELSSQTAVLMNLAVEQVSQWLYHSNLP